MNNWKEHKGLVILSMAVTLLPILAGLILWNQLPGQVPTHFGPTGEPDAWSSKAQAVFFIPLFLVAMQVFCIFMMNWDPKKKNIHKKNFGVVIWIIPVVSLLVAVITALGYLDLILAMVGIPLPMDETVMFFATIAAYCVLITALSLWKKAQVETSYVLAYESIAHPEPVGCV